MTKVLVCKVVPAEECESIVSNLLGTECRCDPDKLYKVSVSIVGTDRADERTEFDAWYAENQGALGHGDQYKKSMAAWFARAALERKA